MTQPFDRASRTPARGELDTEAGEFWVENPFSITAQGENLSAFEKNRLFLNNAGKTFIDSSFAANADIDSDSRSAIVSDFDGDHAPDLLVGSVGGGPLRLFRNIIETTNNRISVKLRGTVSNRSAIGARLIAHTGERLIVRDNFPNNGFMGQSPAELLVGVGDASVIDRLEIRWPSGAVFEFKDVPVNCVLSIDESEHSYSSSPFPEPAD